MGTCTTTTTTDDSINYEDLVKLIEETDRMYPRRSLPKSPFTFGGLRTFETPPPQPKLELSKDVNVSDSYRVEFDLWLLNTFGRRDPLIPDNKFLVSQQFGFMAGNRESMNALKIFANEMV